MDAVLVKDNFLHPTFHQGMVDWVRNSAEFVDMVVSEKHFYVAEVPEPHLDLITTKLENLIGKKIKCLQPFYRMATEELDTDWRIHCDRHVGTEERPTHGFVYYITEHDSIGQESIYGTALWDHATYGHRLPESLTDDVSDKILMEHANDRDKWKLRNVCMGNKNKMITYPANYFHSKFPNKAWGKDQKDCRIVLVMFYKIK